MTKLPETAPDSDSVTDSSNTQSHAEPDAQPERAQELSIPAALPDLVKSARHIAVLSSEAHETTSPAGSHAEDAQDIASLEAFRRNPQRVWAWYEQRREYAARAMPTPLHTALVLLENRVRRFTLITDSIDGLHHRAGSDHVIELHGSLHDTICASNGKRVTSWTVAPGDAPRCPDCGDFLRPDVVWAGEVLPASALAQAQAAMRTCDLLFIIGPIENSAPMTMLRKIAFEHGATIVQIGPQLENRSVPPILRIKGDPARVLMALARTTC